MKFPASTTKWKNECNEVTQYYCTWKDLFYPEVSQQSLFSSDTDGRSIWCSIRFIVNYEWFGGGFFFTQITRMLFFVIIICIPNDVGCCSSCSCCRGVGWSTCYRNVCGGCDDIVFTGHGIQGNHFQVWCKGLGLWDSWGNWPNIQFLVPWSFLFRDFDDISISLLFVYLSLILYLGSFYPSLTNVGYYSFLSMLPLLQKPNPLWLLDGISSRRRSNRRFLWSFFSLWYRCQVGYDWNVFR